MLSGVTVRTEALFADGIHVYEFAPLTLKLALPFTQIALAEAPVTKTGFVFTCKFSVALCEQPAALVPITV